MKTCWFCKPKCKCVNSH